MWHTTWIFKIIFKWRKMTWHELMWHTCMLRELKLMNYSKLYKYKYIWLAFTHDLYKCVDFFSLTLHILYLWQLLDHVIVTQKCIIYAKGLQSSMEFRHSHHLPFGPHLFHFLLFLLLWSSSRLLISPWYKFLLLY
jgi:hypothetical protein